MKQEFKSGFVTIIGRTNVGKSTLLNSIIGEKVAIMTSKPQTTRTAIRGIVNREKSQIIFIDTPGIHKPKTKLGQTMNETAFGRLTEVDVIVFIAEGTDLDVGKGDSLIVEKIKESKKPTILALNKIDLVKKEMLLKTIDSFSNKYQFESIVPISAKSGEGIDTLLNEIEKFLKVRSCIL